eukprot:9410209-Karenia_brevis.AAC.1
MPPRHHDSTSEAIIQVNLHSGNDWIKQKSCSTSGMGQNSAAYGICLTPKGCLRRPGTPACSKTPSVCSDNDDSLPIAFPPSDDEDACAAFLDGLGLGARQMSDSDSDELDSSQYTKNSSQD